jgi:hypothetical protein
MSDEIRVNGNVHSWGSIILKIGDDRFFGFNQIAYADARERTKVYGMGRHHAPRGRTLGKYSTEPVKLRGPKGSVQQLREMLAQQGGGSSYGDVEFEITVQFVEGEDTPITDVIEGCVWAKNSVSHEEGPDALVDEIEVDCMRIRRNDFVLYDESDVQP